MEVHPATLPLADVRDYVERAFRLVAEEKGLEFAVELDDGAPQSIVTDEQRLQQVLRNLLSNAFKFTDEGEVDLRDRAGAGAARRTRSAFIGHATPASASPPTSCG